MICEVVDGFVTIESGWRRNSCRVVTKQWVKYAAGSRKCLSRLSGPRLGLAYPGSEFLGISERKSRYGKVQPYDALYTINSTTLYYIADAIDPYYS